MDEKRVKTETKNSEKDTAKPQDFSHIKGDVDDFIFSFTENKRHSEK